MNENCSPEITNNLNEFHDKSVGQLGYGINRRVKLEKPYRLCRRNRRGAAIVEFAVVVPLFFVLVFGMIEMGRAVMVQQVITNASREGARAAVLDGANSTDVKATVAAYMNSAGIPAAGPDDVTVSPDPLASVEFGESVTVTVTIGFDQVTWLPTPIFMSGDLTATSVMRCERVQ